LLCRKSVVELLKLVKWYRKASSLLCEWHWKYNATKYWEIMGEIRYSKEPHYL